MMEWRWLPHTRKLQGFNIFLNKKYFKKQIHSSNNLIFKEYYLARQVHRQQVESIFVLLNYTVKWFLFLLLNFTA